MACFNELLEMNNGCVVWALVRQLVCEYGNNYLSFNCEHSIRFRHCAHSYVLKSVNLNIKSPLNLVDRETVYGNHIDPLGSECSDGYLCFLIAV